MDVAVGPDESMDAEAGSATSSTDTSDSSDGAGNGGKGGPGSGDPVTPGESPRLLNQVTSTLYCQVEVGGYYGPALVDTGAAKTLINYQLFSRLPAYLRERLEKPDGVHYTSASGEPLRYYGDVQLQLKITGKQYAINAAVMDMAHANMYLGIDFLQRHDGIIDVRGRTLHLGDQVVPLADKPKSVPVICRVGKLVAIPPKTTVKVQLHHGRPVPSRRACHFQYAPSRANAGDWEGLLVDDGLVEPDSNGRIAVLVYNSTDMPKSLEPSLIVGHTVRMSSKEKRGLRQATFEVGTTPSSVEGSSPDQGVNLQASVTPMNKEWAEDEAPRSWKPTDRLDDDEFGKDGSLAESPDQPVQLPELPQLTDTERQLIHDVIERNKDVFAKPHEPVEPATGTVCYIPTGDHPPIALRPYRSAFKHRDAMDEEIQKMEQTGVIQKSASPWAFPVVMVPKKNGELRFCVDYRKLNAVTIKDAHPLPNIEDVLASLYGSRYFTTLDLKSGFWQVPVAEADQEKTAFITHRGLFHFRTMPFGLRNAPAVFQRMMNRVLNGLQHLYALPYIDDIIIHSKSVKEHAKHLEEVFRRLREHRLRLNPAKCTFCQEEIDYLGHLVGRGSIQPNPAKVTAISEMKPPSTVKGVKSFLGVCGYYRKFVRDYAKVAYPLTALTRKDVDFVWGEKQQEAFEALKAALVSKPMLNLPNVREPFRLYTDASDIALGAVLSQNTPEGEKVVYYLSKKFDNTQKAWPSFEREAFAVVYAIERFRHYLVDTRFTVVTDCKALSYVLQGTSTNAKVQRWGVALSQYTFDVEYKEGKKHQNADSLSRPEDTGEQVSTDEDIGDRLLANSWPDVPEVLCQNALVDPVAAAEQEATLGLLEGPASGRPPERMDDGAVQMGDLRLDRASVSELQWEDPDLRQVIEDLRQDPLAYRRHGVQPQYYLNADTLVVPGEQPGEERLVVPTVLTKVLMRAMHEQGHLGREKLKGALRERYYWPGMTRDVGKYVQNCLQCLARKGRPDTARMGDVPIPHQPFEVVSIDTQGPLPRTLAGNQYILCFVDLCTGWPECYAVPDKSAETIIDRFVNDFIPRHSCPQKILTDNGTEFVNKLMKELTTKLGIHHITIAPYNPQANGKNERYHRTLNDMLSCVGDAEPEWDRALPQVLAAYRAAAQATTGFSPFFMVYGRRPVHPVDTYLAPRGRTYKDDPVAIMLRNLHRAFTMARDRTHEARERNRVRVDQKAKDVSFEPGDQVLLLRHDRRNKLDPLFEPGYTIATKESPQRYLVRHDKTGKYYVAFVTQLKLAPVDANWGEPVIQLKPGAGPTRGSQSPQAVKQVPRPQPTPQKRSQEGHRSQIQDLRSQTDKVGAQQGGQQVMHPVQQPPGHQPLDQSRNGVGQGSGPWSTALGQQRSSAPKMETAQSPTVRETGPLPRVLSREFYGRRDATSDSGQQPQKKPRYGRSGMLGEPPPTVARRGNLPFWGKSAPARTAPEPARYQPPRRSKEDRLWHLPWATQGRRDSRPGGGAESGTQFGSGQTVGHGKSDSSEAVRYGSGRRAGKKRRKRRSDSDSTPHPVQPDHTYARSLPRGSSLGDHTYARSPPQGRGGAPRPFPHKPPLEGPPVPTPCTPPVVVQDRQVIPTPCTPPVGPSRSAVQPVPCTPPMRSSVTGDTLPVPCTPPMVAGDASRRTGGSATSKSAVMDTESRGMVRKRESSSEEARPLTSRAKIDEVIPIETESRGVVRGRGSSSGSDGPDTSRRRHQMAEEVKDTGKGVVRKQRSSTSNEEEPPRQRVRSRMSSESHLSPRGLVRKWADRSDSSEDAGQARRLRVSAVSRAMLPGISHGSLSDTSSVDPQSTQSEGGYSSDTSGTSLEPAEVGSVRLVPDKCLHGILRWRPEDKMRTVSRDLLVDSKNPGAGDEYGLEQRQEALRNVCRVEGQFIPLEPCAAECVTGRLVVQEMDGDAFDACNWTFSEGEYNEWLDRLEAAGIPRPDDVVRLLEELERVHGLLENVGGEFRRRHGLEPPHRVHTSRCPSTQTWEYILRVLSLTTDRMHLFMTTLLEELPDHVITCSYYYRGLLQIAQSKLDQVWRYLVDPAKAESVRRAVGLEPPLAASRSHVRFMDRNEVIPYPTDSHLAEYRCRVSPHVPSEEEVYEDGRMLTPSLRDV